MFRGIDDVYNALAPALVKHGLIIMPRMIDRHVTERVTKNGGVLFYVVVKAEFDFISAEDGSKHTVVTFGEAMDSGDKATNKAMSIAYKYAAFQAFCIPTEETAADPDYDIHRVQAQQKPVLALLSGQALDAVNKWIGDGLSASHIVERLSSKYDVSDKCVAHIKSITS